MLELCIILLIQFTVNLSAVQNLLGKLKSASCGIWYRMKAILGCGPDAFLARGAYLLCGRSCFRAGAVQRGWNAAAKWSVGTRSVVADGAQRDSRLLQQGPLCRFWDHIPVHSVLSTGCQILEAPPAAVTSVLHLVFFSPCDFLGESQGSCFGYTVKERRVGESLQGHLCLEAVLLAFSPPLSSWLSNGKRRLCSCDPGERPTLRAETAEASSSGSGGESYFARKALCFSACLFLPVTLQHHVYFCLR